MKLFVREKTFYRNLAAIGIPIAAQQLVTAGVNMTDNVMLGSLGEIQMSGAALANQFIMIFHTCCMGLGMGAGVLTSRFWGMGARESMKKSVLLMYRLVFWLAVLFSILTAVVPEAIMRIFIQDPDVIAAGAAYFRISIPCFLLTGFSLTTSLVLRSVGKAKLPLISSIAAFFLNVFFNWVFIYGKLGAPRMEIRGAALGTLIARIFEFLFIMLYFLFKDSSVHLRISDFSMNCRDLRPEYVRISIPVFISDSILALGNSAVAVVMGQIGAAFVAANSIVSVVMQMATVVIQGISQASCVITGNTLGRGEAKKAQEQGVTMVSLGILLGFAGGMLILVIAEPVVDVYQVSRETGDLAVELMRALAVVIAFQCANSVLTKGVLRGGGDTRFLMVADVIFLWCVSIPLGAAAGLWWKWPGFWIYICLRADQVLKAVLCIIRLRSKKWMKKIQPAESNGGKDG